MKYFPFSPGGFHKKNVTLAISRLAGFSFRHLTNTQAAISTAGARPQSGSGPTGGGALTPFRPRSPASCGIN